MRASSFFFSPELKCWLKCVTDKYMHWCMVSAAVWLPPLKLKKKTPSTQPQTSHIRDGCSARTHHLHMYCSPDISRCVHAGICQAGWETQKQWLCLAKVDITDLLNSFSNCCRFFDWLLCFSYKLANLRVQCTGKPVAKPLLMVSKG